MFCFTHVALCAWLMLLILRGTRVAELKFLSPKEIVITRSDQDQNYYCTMVPCMWQVLGMKVRCAVLNPLQLALNSQEGPPSPGSNPGDLWPFGHFIRVMRGQCPRDMTWSNIIRAFFPEAYLQNMCFSNCLLESVFFWSVFLVWIFLECIFWECNFLKVYF